LPTLKSYSLSTNYNHYGIQEDEILKTTITTKGIEDGENVFWSLKGEGINQDDFSSGALDGVSTIVNNQANFEHTLSIDKTTEGTEDLYIQLFKDSARQEKIEHEPAHVVIIDSSKEPNPKYSLITSTGDINEGDVLKTTIQTTDVEDGTAINWSIFGKGIDQDDFSSGNLQGVSTIKNNQAVFTHTLSNDKKAEGVEQLRIHLDGIPAPTPTIDINDTSNNLIEGELNLEISDNPTSFDRNIDFKEGSQLYFRLSPKK